MAVQSALHREFQVKAGDLVELHPCEDIWMRGIKTAKIKSIGRKWVTLDATIGINRTKHRFKIPVNRMGNLRLMGSKEWPEQSKDDSAGVLTPPTNRQWMPAGYRIKLAIRAKNENQSIEFENFLNDASSEEIREFTDMVTLSDWWDEFTEWKKENTPVDKKINIPTFTVDEEGPVDESSAFIFYAYHAITGEEMLTVEEYPFEMDRDIAEVRLRDRFKNSENAHRSSSRSIQVTGRSIPVPSALSNGPCQT